MALGCGAEPPATKPASESAVAAQLSHSAKPSPEAAPIAPPQPLAIVEKSQPTQETAEALPAAPPPIDEDRVAAQGIRKLASEQLTLYTDLPLDAEIKSLPEQFDQAYPQWRKYFGLADQQAKPWRVVGRLMKDEAKFRAAGLLPDELPQFQFGYTRGDEIWWREQPSAYYRRHLMLHEGTHS
ncbi:MAG TPA: hypothetical protein VHB99_16930, partial [Pirellulales bacterium]|nr:hypothetical protein [Pirellulales bacterium]